MVWEYSTITIALYLHHFLQFFTAQITLVSRIDRKVHSITRTQDDYLRAELGTYLFNFFTGVG